MKLFSATLSVALTLAVAASSPAAAQPEKAVRESAREIPVAYDVDVVVVGGSSGAVAAAVEAAQEGASVFLAAPRPYLGEDICATYRLWLEPGEEPDDALAKALFAEPPAAYRIGPGMAFTYEADRPSAALHQDTDPPSRLTDGKCSNAANESVQYEGDVTITADLGEKKPIGRVHLLAYQRRNEFEVAEFAVELSEDGQNWAALGTMAKNEKLGTTDFEGEALCITLPVDQEARFLRVISRQTPAAKRQLLAELVIDSPGPPPSAAGPQRTPPMPMQVKRVLDQALLDAGVEFLFGCYPVGVLRDEKGDIAGIVMANRSGRQAVRARAVIDATPRASVARMAGVAFDAYPSGTRTFRRVVIGGDSPANATVVPSRELSPVQAELGSVTSQTYSSAYEYEIDLPVQDGRYAAFAEAEQRARDLTWRPGQKDASEVLFEIPPDSVHTRTRVRGEWPGAKHVSLDAFRSRETQGIFLLNGCAAVSREAAAAMLRPLELIAIGRRIGEAAAKEAGVTPKPVVVCLGDSITAGGYPARLARAARHLRIVNAGVGGDTTAEALVRIGQDVLRHKPRAVVVMLGANDSVMPAEGQFRVPVDQYEADLREIVRQCRESGAEVLLCTIPPVVAEPYYTRHPKEFYDGQGGLDAVLDTYRSALRRVADSLQVPLADVFASMSAAPSSIREDGVHLSMAGERLLAAFLAERLSAILPETPEATPSAEGIHVAAASGGSLIPGDVRENLTGVRPEDQPDESVPSPECDVPVLAEYDVVILGGGTGGAPAGIAAARQGAKTLLVEYLHGLGGVSTLGLIGSYYYGYRGGFTAEMDESLRGVGAETRKGAWDPEAKSEWYRAEMRKAGADIWYGVLGCGAVLDGNRVTGIVVATPDGRGVVLAKTVIDSTGNSDVAAAAGAHCMYTDASDVAVQGTGMPPRKLGASYTNTDYTLTDDSDVVDIWRTFVAGREKYPQAYDMAQVIDTRERRRIVGDFVISPLDIFAGRTYSDTIGQSMSNFDTHGFTVHPVFSLRPPDKESVTAYTPYRALLPKDLDGLLVTGLGISAHRDAMPILRMQPDIQNQGYAAGVAAAMAARENLSTRAIDIKALQRHLVEKGCVPESVLTDTDEFEVSPEELHAAVTQLVDGLAGLETVLAHADEAMPALREAFQSASNPEHQLAYARVLGMLGDPAGVDVLLGKVAEVEWDEGWAFKGMGQFGGSVSYVDSLILALGRTQDPRGVDVILGKVATLTPQHPFSHHRAVAMALETLGDPKATQPLAELLRKPGMMGHAAPDIEDAKYETSLADPDLSRELALRELILARALYRCGDYEGLGEGILREYARDVRGHHARHANAVLNEE